MGFGKNKEKRRVQRYSNILSKSFHVSVTENPTQFLAICNGGLANGLSQERILDFFGQNVLDITMPHGESVSFVTFRSAELCQKAVDDVTEEGLKWDGGGPAFFAFVDRTPGKPDVLDIYQPPPGLIILENFVNEVEEQCLMECLSLDEDTSSLRHRTVKHFGREFSYGDNRADGVVAVPPIPAEFDELWLRLADLTGVHFEPDQCTVNRYLPGQGIPPHVDTHSAFTEVIVCLSLQSDVVMDWRQGATQRHVLVPRRSMSLFTEDARYGWTHGITPRKSDVVAAKDNRGLTLVPRSLRTSVTFRRTRTGPCIKCPYPGLCDSVPSSPNVDQNLAAKLENASVHQVYEEIAEHFSMTRHKPWPNVVKFLNTFSPGDIILDVGCGNGKYIGVREDIAVVGLDRSNSLLELSMKMYPSRAWLVQADCLQLPARDSCADGVISIAVLHHLSTNERRVQGVREIARVLRPGGRALIYVWAKNQQADATKSSYLKQRKQKKEAPEGGGEREIEGVRLLVHTNRTDFKSADMLVPWQEKTSGATYLRYYHVFEEEELKELCGLVPGIQCRDYYYDQGNWCIIFEKKLK